MGRISKEKLCKAIIEAHGNLTCAAKAIGTSRVTVHRYVNQHPEVKAAVEQARENLGDHAENKLKELIDKGHPAAIMFYLKCQHKGRGWVERKETTGKDGGPIEMANVDKPPRVNSAEDWLTLREKSLVGQN